MSDIEKDTQPKKKRGGLAFLFIAPLALAGAGGIGAYVMGMVTPPGDRAAEAAVGEGLDAAEVDPNEIAFVTLPDLLVNLNVTGNRLRFLKFSASLEVADAEEAEQVTRLVPRIADNIHAYLRAVQVGELGGPDAVYRVKRDLLARVNQVVRPLQVRDVLVGEMLIQ